MLGKLPDFHEGESSALYRIYITFFAALNTEIPIIYCSSCMHCPCTTLTLPLNSTLDTNVGWNHDRVSSEEYISIESRESIPNKHIQNHVKTSAQDHVITNSRTSRTNPRRKNEFKDSSRRTNVLREAQGRLPNLM